MILDLPYSHKILANLFQTIHQRGGVVWVVPRTNVKESVKYFGNKDNQEADVVLNDDFALLKSSSLTAKRLNESLSTYLKDEPSFGEIGWMMGGTSYTRLASRFSSAQSKLMSLFLLTLPHVVLNYYGDELLLQDTRDGKSFAMMKWSNDTKAGIFACHCTDCIWIFIEYHDLVHTAVFLSPYPLCRYCENCRTSTTSKYKFN